MIEVVDWPDDVLHVMRVVHVPERPPGHGVGVDGTDVTSIREPLGVVAGITPFNFPAMSDVDVPRDRVRPRVRAQCRASAIRRRRCCSRSSGQKRVCRRRLLGGARRHGRRRRDPRAPGNPRGQLRRLDPIARHVYETAASAGKRVQALGERRTTWSCSPTPTSTRLPTPRSAPGTGPRASAAWPSRWSSRSGGVADPLVAAVAAPREVSGRRRRRLRLRDGPARDRRAPRPVARVRRSRCGPGRDARRRRARRVGRGVRRRLLPRPVPLRPRGAGDVDLPGRDLWPRALGRPRADLRRRGRLLRATPSPTARRSSPGTVARPGGSCTRPTPGWWA